MDIRCPECDRQYSDIDFSLAGSKFGCECGHKFFLSERGVAKSAPGEGAKTTSDSKLGSDSDQSNYSKNRFPEPPKPEIKVNAPKKRGLDINIDDPDDDLFGGDDFQPAPARKGRFGAMLLNQFLNLILVLLLISLCVCGYLFATGKLKSPLEIKLKAKEPVPETSSPEAESTAK